MAMWTTCTSTKPGCRTRPSTRSTAPSTPWARSAARPQQIGGVFATQSIHKLLAGISQASHVLVQDSQNTKLDRHLFNEAYLMHTSTSPQYSIIASCDVAAAMMEPPGGTRWWKKALPRRWTSAAPCARSTPSLATTTGGSRSGAPTSWPTRASAAPTTGCSSAPTAKACKPADGEEAWHGFGDMAPGFNMLDPIKATIVTPGLNMKGDFAATGIPASIVTKFLAEHGVVVEKTGLYSFFIMFTIGITKGRWNTLLTALQQFKDDYDRNQPMWRILPEFCQKHRATSRWACATCASTCTRCTPSTTSRA
jgi:arginine decarboxylase